ncbi:MAG: hypothetical protein AAF889_14325 [Cyanobacteria bacterium P01_D01_bin.73]
MGKTLVQKTVSITSVCQNHGTPLYVYDLDKIREQFRRLSTALPRNFQVHYALKANSNLTVCHLLADEGAASEVSSLGELIAALKSGFSPENTVFTGPGKTDFELANALEYGVGLVVVESVNEAQRLNLLAEDQGKKQPTLLRINPEYRTLNSCDISCAIAPSNDLRPIAMNGQGASKFGVGEKEAEDALEAISNLPHLDIQGIHIFTESNVLDYRHLLDAWRNTVVIANRLRSQGFSISILDFGGGIGVPYNATDREFDIETFGQELAAVFNETPYRCMVEMGRYIACEGGSYVVEVVDIKESNGQKFAIVNGGIHNIYRTPGMQKASEFLTVLGKENLPTIPTVLAGQLPTPIDIITREAPLPIDLEIGDLIMVRNCGAYGYNHSLANFALHPHPAEVAYSGDRIELIRSRGSYEDFFAHQKLIDF